MKRGDIKHVTVGAFGAEYNIYELGDSGKNEKKRDGFKEVLLFCIGKSVFKYKNAKQYKYYVPKISVQCK